MSFNQLPDELIAQVASHLYPKNMARLLQTQKRIRWIIRRFKMDTKIFNLKICVFIDNCSRQITRIECGGRNEYRNEVLSNETQEFANFLKRFRLINSLSLQNDTCRPLGLGKEFADMLLTVDTKIKNISFKNIAVGFPSDECVNFCKQFLTVRSEHNYLPLKGYFRENDLCQITSTTEINIVIDTKCVGLRFTDKLLECMSAGKTSSVFQLHNVKTDFTVNGIRRIFERSLDRNMKFGWNFGILPEEQLVEAERWLVLNQTSLEVTYTGRKIVSTRGEGPITFVFCGPREDQFLSFTIEPENHPLDIIEIDL